MITYTQWGNRDAADTRRKERCVKNKLHFLSIGMAPRIDCPLLLWLLRILLWSLQSFVAFARNTWKTLLNMRDQAAKHDVFFSRAVVSSSNR